MASRPQNLEAFCISFIRLSLYLGEEVLIINTYTNRNGDESYISTGRSKAAQTAATARYRQNSQEAYRFLKDVSAQLGITPSEFLTQANAHSVAAIVAAALAEDTGETTNEGMH